MTKKEVNQAYLESFRLEKAKLHEERTSFVIHKITFISTLFGLSAIKFEEFRIKEILYFVPLIAIFFDVYIGETNLAIRLRGRFIRHCSNKFTGEIGEVENAWENDFSRKYRSILTPLTNFFLTLLTTVASFGYLAILNGNYKHNLIGNISIFGIYVIFNLTIFFYYRKRGKIIDQTAQKEISLNEIRSGEVQAAVSKEKDSTRNN